VLLRPFQNTPFVDDWVYGWSVEHLLLTGELRILDNASSVNPVQVLWGALFCLPTGFSFTMLRVSTWVLSAACLCGLRLLMSEIGVGRAQALLATATLALYPVYFVLSHTFMTDVPFLCALVWFSYAAARALRTERLGWLAVAVLFAALAIGIRPAGIVAALALPLTIVPLNRWRRWSALVLMLLPFVAAGLVFWWYSSHIERRADLTWIDGSPAWRRWQFRYGLASIHVSAVNMWWFCTAALGLAVAPLAIARFSRTHVRGAVVVSMIGAGAFALGPLIGAHVYVPLHNTETWALVELGGVESGVWGHRAPALPRWYAPTAVAAGVALFSMGAAAAISVRRLSAAQMLLLWLLAMQYLLMSVLWLYDDNRYILPLVPPALALIASSGPLVRQKPAIAMLAALAVICSVGLRDHLQYNRALWAAVDYLRAGGTPPGDIDGGWAVNGWLQYAHPEHAKRAPGGDVLVNWVNANDVESQARISNGPSPGWMVDKVFPYTRWASRSGAIYVLKR